MAFHSYIVLFLLLLLLFPLNISCQNISMGQSLSPSTNPSSLISPSGDFAFGFRALETDPTLFLLAVYYHKIKAKTVIWTANGANPLSSQSIAQLTPEGQLTLQDSSYQQIWIANISGASYGFMRDDGNFILYSGSSAIWQTFDYPTDTILPRQILNQDSTIYAKITDDDYSKGRFKLEMQSDGNLVMYAVGFPTTSLYDPYYATRTDGNTGKNRLVFNETGSLYVLFDNGTSVPVLSNPTLTGDNYLRATLDPDGGFRQYVFPKSQLITGSWSIAANLVPDLCSNVFNLGSGICGFNSYCTQYDSGLANCTCLPHYTFVDPTRKYKGCKPDYITQLCEHGSGSSFAFQAARSLNWPISDAEKLSPMNETQCQAECLNDCFCLVAIYNNVTGNCLKKKFPLSNGIKIDQDVNRVAFIKYNTLNISSNGTSNVSSNGTSNVSSNGSSNVSSNGTSNVSSNGSSNVSSDGSGNWKSWVIIVSSILIGSVVSNLLLIGACFCTYRKRKRERNSPKISSIVSAMCSFTYKELEQATKGFSEELGKGAFGVVYKGVLPSQYNKNNTLTVAVKKLEESLLEEGEQDFENEVATIGQTHHKNLVQLIGFCKEGSHRLIVFEFLSKGSLNKYIFGSNRPNWNQRVQITLGIANGLAYLHEECRNPIIHCDIKPQNILLDENMEARISDFGLAKLLRFDQTRTATGIRGTIGYFAPEWFKNVAISAKVDVYSFGVMLLQIICCKKNFEWGLGSQERTTVIDWAKNCYKNGRLDLLVEDDEDAKSDGIRLQRLVKVGISCVEDEPSLRPTMKKVVQMLEGTIGPSIIYGNSENYLSCK